MNDTPELKPCPFCGGNGYLHKDPDQEHGDFYCIRCSKCRSKSSELYAIETCPIFLAQVRDAWNTRAEPTPAQIMADPRVKALMESMTVARRAIGDHAAPNDCYSTGPLTGDNYIDLVQCPACTFIELHDKALAALEPKP